MVESRRTEISLDLDLTSLPRLWIVSSVRREVQRAETEVSVFYDTGNMALRKSGVLLHIRRVGKRRVQVVSLTGGGPPRDCVWEGQVTGDSPDFQQVENSRLRKLLSKPNRRKLTPIFEVRLRRETHKIRGDRNLTLVVDRGRIAAGKSVTPVCQIEIRGAEPSAVFDIARTLAREIPAELAFASLADRGYALAAHSKATAVSLDKVALTLGMSTRDALRAIGRACLKQAVGNGPAVLAGDSEGVHQMRIGLRRLRAAISLFADVLPDPETKRIKQELRWLMGELGPVRELDVFLLQVVLPVKRRSARQGIANFADELAQQRGAAFARAQRALRSEHYRTLIFDIAAWLENGVWSRPEDDLARSLCDTPVEVLAASQLARHWKKIRRKCGSLAKLDPRSRHKLRIRAKKLRYATDFFSGLFAGHKAVERRKAFVRSLKAMQEHLGELNDIAVHAGLTASMAARDVQGEPERSTGRRAFAAGLLTGHEDARFDRVMHAANSAAAAFSAVRPFWK